MTADVTDVFNSIRESEGAFVACEEADPSVIFDTSHQFIYDLGKKSIPSGVAATMHAYVLAAIASYPIPRLHPYALARRRLLRRIRDERALIANTVLCSMHSSKDPAVLEKCDGRYFLSGFGRFMSLATVADYAFVQATSADDGLKALCMVPLKNSARYQPGELVFSGSMSATDTRTVTFDRCPVDSAQITAAVNEAEVSVVARYQQAWFQALAPTAYLGGICGLLERAQHQCSGPAESDRESLVLRRALGRARLKLYAARTLSIVARDALKHFTNSPKQGIDNAYDSASLAKVIGFDLAEDAVSIVRKAAGITCLSDPANQDVLSEVHYGRLHPASDKLIEEYFYDHQWQVNGVSQP